MVTKEPNMRATIEELLKDAGVTFHDVEVDEQGIIVQIETDDELTTLKLK